MFLHAWLVSQANLNCDFRTYKFNTRQEFLSYFFMHFFHKTVKDVLHILILN